MNGEYEYPYSRKWVFFSILLVTLSSIFVIFALSDIFLILVYVALTFILAGIFYYIKLHIYFRAHKLQPERELTKKDVIFMIILIFTFGFFLPIFSAYLIGPLIWFLMITAFISGINIPEIVLYIKYARCQKKDD